MSNDILNSLNGYTTIHDQKLASIAQNAAALTEEYNGGELSASEYAELLEDLETQTRITEGAADLNAQKQLNTIINVAITLAKTAAKAI
jgi:polyhydroxyalkanoate synthesis regulator phasin